MACRAAYHVILSLCLMAPFQGLGNQETCIVPCRCQPIDDQLYMYCSQKSLTQVPGNFTRAVFYLDLSFNHFPRIENDAFHQLNTLVHLDLRFNDIEDLADGAFVGLRRLQELDLGHNSIQNIAPNMFSSLHSLRVLVLSNNQLRVIQNNAFSGLHLTNLNLQNNIHLQVLTENAFLGANITSMALNRCNLSHVHTQSFSPLRHSLKTLFWSHGFTPLSLPKGLFAGSAIDNLVMENNTLRDLHFLEQANFTLLDIAYNTLDVLDLDAMTHFRFTRQLRVQSNQLMDIQGTIQCPAHMEHLDLSFNRLTYIRGSLLKCMPKLVYLSLKANRLKTLSSDFLPAMDHLHYLDLVSNPLVCDCQMDWLQDWALSTANIGTVVDAQCSVPTNGSLQEADTSQCIVPSNVHIFDTIDGDGIQFVCSANGSKPFSYSWHFYFTAASNISDNTSSHARGRVVGGVGCCSDSAHAPPRSNTSVGNVLKVFLRQHQCASVTCTVNNTHGTSSQEYFICLHEHARHLAAERDVAHYVAVICAVPIVAAFVFIVIKRNKIKAALRLSCRRAPSRGSQGNEFWKQSDDSEDEIQFVHEGRAELPRESNDPRCQDTVPSCKYTRLTPPSGSS